MDYTTKRQQAVALLASPEARLAFDIEREPDRVRDRYGRNRFGQSVLLARRLVQAGIALVQVNWPRLSNLAHWDTHAANAKTLKDQLMPVMDQAYSALLEDLAERSMLQETLVVWTGEFGRTPKISGSGGRDHWGDVFSAALAGRGVKGGQAYGASDRTASQGKEGMVEPQDLLATVYHCLNIDPDTEILDGLGRPRVINRGNVLRSILA